MNTWLQAGLAVDALIVGNLVVFSVATAIKALLGDRRSRRTLQRRAQTVRAARRARAS